MKTSFLALTCLLPFNGAVVAESNHHLVAPPLVLETPESEHADSQSLFPSSVRAKISGDVRFSMLSGPQEERHTTVLKSKSDKDGSESVEVTKSFERDRNFMLAVDGSKLGVTFEVDLLPGVETEWNLSLGTLTSKIGIKDNYLKIHHGDLGEVRLGDTDGVADGSEAFLEGHELSRPLSSFTAPGDYVGVTTGVLAHNGLGGNAIDVKSCATKVTYLSPRIEGFQVGVSFTPNTQRSGEDALKAGHPDDKDAKPFGVNVVGVEANFQQKVTQDIKVSLSATAALGKIKPEIEKVSELERHDLKSVGLGALVKVGSFRLAGTFVNNFKTGQMKQDADNVEPADTEEGSLKARSYASDKATAGQAVSVGLGMKVGQVSLGMGYVKGWRATGFGDDEAVGSSLTCRANYKFNKHVVLGAEFGSHGFNNPSGMHEATLLAKRRPEADIDYIGDQKAYTFVLSTRIKW